MTLRFLVRLLKSRLNPIKPAGMKALAALLLLIGSTSAHAGQWLHHNNKETGMCAFTATYDGPGNPSLTVFQRADMYKDSVVGFLVTNKNWSISSADDLKSKFEIETDTDKFEVTPTAVENGLMFAVSRKDSAELMNSSQSFLSVSKDGTEISRLDVSGIWLEQLTFNRCMAEKDLAKAEKNRLEALEKMPKDPFAN